jgi:hypothetical protein
MSGLVNMRSVVRMDKEWTAKKNHRMERNCSKNALVDRVEDGSMTSERIWEK